MQLDKNLYPSNAILSIKKKYIMRIDWHRQFQFWIALLSSIMPVLFDNGNNRRTVASEGMYPQPLMLLVKFYEVQFGYRLLPSYGSLWS